MNNVKNFLSSRLKLILAHPILRRALHTWWQTASAVFLVGIPLVVHVLRVKGFSAGEEALVGLATASAAAGFSAVKSYIVVFVESRRS